MSTAINPASIVNNHLSSLDLMAEDLKDSSLKLVDTDEFSKLFGEKIQQNLSEAGKATFGTGLNADALTTLQDQLKKNFNKDYHEVIDLSMTELQRSNEPKIAFKNAKASLASKLKKTSAELLSKMIAELSAKGQTFNAEDQVQLNNAFKQYVDKTTEKLNESLNQLKSLDSTKLRLQAHNAINSTTFQKKAALRAEGLNNTRSLSDIPKPPPPTPGFTVNSNNLYQQLKYTIATKPSEPITIELSIPNREENQRQIAEAGLQHRIPGLALLVSLLLWLFVHLRLYLKNDEQSIKDAINKLIKEDGLSIDPKDIKLKISQIGQNGKDHVIQEGALSEITLQELDQSRQEIKKLLQEGISNNQKNKHTASTTYSSYNSAEENEDEKSEQRSTFSNSRSL